MAKKNNVILFVVILVLAFFCFNLAFPDYYNGGVDFLKNKKIPVLGYLPHFPDVKYKLGLDLQGGSHLEYQADLQNIEQGAQKDTMAGLRDVIERRVNAFGVGEPVVSVQEVGGNYRLIVELPGVQDIGQAIKMIGKTPYLEFKEERTKEETQQILDQQKAAAEELNAASSASSTVQGATTSAQLEQVLSEDPYFRPTELNGRFLQKAALGFDQRTMEPQVLLEFNSEGAKLFEQITEKNVGKRLAIYIDNGLISAPNVNEKIAGGKAQITGKFTVKEAKDLARNLNAGALPVPIELVSQNTIGPSLGLDYLNKSLKAGLWGFLAIMIFMVVFYRLPGLLACFALIVYSAILLTLFKFIPVTLSLAGIGGAILSLGMAVDANILVFARQREEAKQGKGFEESFKQGFSRAWPSIRDSNVTTLLIGLIMFAFGSSFVKGFALTLSLGILASMFSALVITRAFIMMFAGTKAAKLKRLW
ncbi:MAG: protein translocase subunit SecD [Patescibacteria group bacterium]|nr:protein translocase subunit SecD [Patescibacteria group bacterium]